MRVVFMGTPDFAVPSLDVLADGHELPLVVTRPDAVRGRGRTLAPSPVKAAALRRGIPVVEARRVTPDLVQAVRDARPDLVAVAAFGAILPDELLALPPRGCVNVHASLLPRWRGAAPIQRALMAGDERVGVSIMRLVHDLDAGAYCRQASLPVGDLGAAELTRRLGELGARELAGALDDLAAGTIDWVEQDEALVTFAPKVEKAEMLLSPAYPARRNLSLVRASLDAAPARCRIAGQGVR
ncbi:methionyl-tRNA formyltransferase, partial [Olsenella massiliensis]|uniref:methionyl-tRNA formyltransferase n=1 Tax=Olsenella massiliensis TaxID=1622075 RepID=UPI00071DB2F7